ncbi:hypothetical protein FNH05_10900 [Amycolatopsis rhizosphaerae]|uniref:Uncharacterized protein n=1 Tax=Amycolatopsis rhizosphaerae TaxID=2053003 RepID=A0A558CZ95_9PSEU|nr:hypothetical protein [Amycolatopsis rhizosphaerae]TVT54096.1 hypothetical protein FNH05_10900 [Amycolatopsis rhizosphaerae]
MASTSGLAQADTAPTQPGTWVFIKWYPGSDSMASLYQCNQDAVQQYPGHDYNCTPSGNTLQLWVRF